MVAPLPAHVPSAWRSRTPLQAKPACRGGLLLRASKPGVHSLALEPVTSGSTTQLQNGRTTLSGYAAINGQQAAASRDSRPVSGTATGGPQNLTAALQRASVGGAALEFEPRYYGLRDINQKEGTFESDFGLKIRWGPEHSSPDAQPLPFTPQIYVSETLGVTELDRSEVVDLPDRPGWREQFVRWRSRSLTSFQLQHFPYDSHKLQVVVRVPRIKMQGFKKMTVAAESKHPPTMPDLGLQEWLVLRRRCYIRTAQAGVRVTSTAKPPLLQDGVRPVEVRQGAASVQQQQHHHQPQLQGGAAPLGSPRQHALSSTTSLDLSDERLDAAGLEFLQEELLEEQMQQMDEEAAREAAVWDDSLYGAGGMGLSYLSSSTRSLDTASTAAAAAPLASASTSSRSSSDMTFVGLDTVDAVERRSGGTQYGDSGGSDREAPYMESTAPKDGASAKPEVVLEYLVQRRATFWMTSVMVPLLVMELFVPMAFSLGPSDLGYKLSIATTLQLLLVSFKLALSDKLPAVAYLTTLDRHFIVIQVWMMCNTLAHCVLYLIYSNASLLKGTPLFGSDPLMVREDMELGAIAISMLVLMYVHGKMWVEYHVPYMKIVSMFERRNSYAPPMVKIMNVWKDEDEDGSFGTNGSGNASLKAKQLELS